MAAICAGRCALSHIRSNPRALFTYGAPRVGSRRYVNYVQFEAYRWVNNNDIVPRLPPAWLGFRHKGQEMYLNSYGQICRLSSWQRIKDRWRGFLHGLRQRQFDHFADHSIAQYIGHIRSAVKLEEQSVRPLRLPTAAYSEPLRRAA